MGSVCASTLSLLDSGVPLKKLVSGIAMGLIKEEEKFGHFKRYSRYGRFSWRYGF